MPRFTERGDRILACRGIAPDTKAAVAAIPAIDGPAPCSLTRCRRTRHAVEDAAHLNAIGEHDKVVRCFVSRIRLESKQHRPPQKDLPPIAMAPAEPRSKIAADCWPVAVNWYRRRPMLRGNDKRRCASSLLPARAAKRARSGKGGRTPSAMLATLRAALSLR
jgi:hypothetical protein